MEVCLSPGCVADGAEHTLLGLRTLLSFSSSATLSDKGEEKKDLPSVVVKAGDCVSLCGNGPIVICNGVKKVKQVNSASKMSELLFGSDGGDSSKGFSDAQKTMIQALDTLQDGNNSKKANNFEEASVSYEKAVVMGMKVIDSFEGKVHSSCYQWLAQARRDQASCYLEINNIDKAVVSAKDGSHFATKEGDDALLYTCLEVYQEALEKTGDAVEELRVLDMFMGLPEPSNQIQKNKRRQLGFRRQRLEREAKQ